MKEKIAVIVCLTLSAVILISGLYDFLIIEFAPVELITSIGASLLLIGIGLAPSIFFNPLNKDSLKVFPKAIVHPKIQQGLFYTGLSLSALSFIFRFVI